MYSTCLSAAMKDKWKCQMLGKSKKIYNKPQKYNNNNIIEGSIYNSNSTKNTLTSKHRMQS